MDVSKVYYRCARERRLHGRGRAYRLIPQSAMPAIRTAYRQRRTPRDRTEAQATRFSMTSLLQARSTATVLETGERISRRDVS